MFHRQRIVLVMGLKFCQYIDGLDNEILEIKMMNIYTKYLKHATSLNNEELEELFENANFKNDQDVVKVALLNFLHSGFLGFSYKFKIDMRLVTMLTIWTF